MDDAWRRLEQARVAVLATLNEDGLPDLVPVVHAVLDGSLWFAVDDVKLKRTGRLQRLANIERRPDVTLLVQHYEDDWDRLWWVRVRGRAAVVPPGPRADRALDALAARYRQYETARPPGPVVEVVPREVRGWSAR